MGIWNSLKPPKTPDEFEAPPQPDEQQYDVPSTDPYLQMPTPRPPQTLGSDYYKEVQVKIYHEEMMRLKARLEGKVLYIDEDTGEQKWDYPLEYVRDKDTGQILCHKDGKPKVKVIIDPFCNIQGQTTILAFFDERVGPGTILSNYSIETVLNRCYDDAEKLALELKLNLRKWQIDPTRWEELHFSIMDRIEAARRRAVNNKEREGTNPNMSVTTLHQDNPSGNKVGFLGGLMGGNRQNRM